MPFLAILAITVLGIVGLVHRYGHKWVIDRVKCAYTDSSIKAFLEPLKLDGAFVGFNLRVENQSEREILVNWSESQYWHDGSTNGKLLFSDTPFSLQLNNQHPNDTIFGHAAMSRNLVPAANLKEDKTSSSSMLYPIDGGTIIDEEDFTPPPSYSVLETEEGDDGIMRAVGGSGKHPPVGSLPPKKRTRRTVRSSPSVLIGNNQPSETSLYAGSLPEGQHGVVLSVVKDGEPQKIALSFDLKKERRSK